jgi:hypothetical protein
MPSVLGGQRKCEENLEAPPQLFPISQERYKEEKLENVISPTMKQQEGGGGETQLVAAPHEMLSGQNSPTDGDDTEEARKWEDRSVRAEAIDRRRARRTGTARVAVSEDGR